MHWHRVSIASEEDGDRCAFAIHRRMDPPEPVCVDSAVVYRLWFIFLARTNSRSVHMFCLPPPWYAQGDVSRQSPFKTFNRLLSCLRERS